LKTRNQHENSFFDYFQQSKNSLENIFHARFLVQGVFKNSSTNLFRILKLKISKLQHFKASGVYYTPRYQPGLKIGKYVVPPAF